MSDYQLLSRNSEVDALIGYYRKEHPIGDALRDLRRFCLHKSDFSLDAFQLFGLHQFGIESETGLFVAGLFSIYSNLDATKNGRLGVVANRVHLSLLSNSHRRTVIERRIEAAVKSRFDWRCTVSLVRTLQHYDGRGLNYYDIFDTIERVRGQSESVGIALYADLYRNA